MSEEKIDEAIKEAKASTEIEDLKIYKEDEKLIKDSLEKDSSNNSFIFSLLKRIEDNKNNGKKK